MDQQQMWNERFSQEGFMYGEHPNVFIQTNVSRIKEGGDVLCLAEGEGRNAIFLAHEGFHVEALDASDVGLAKLSKRADDLQLDITTSHIDLATWKPAKKYDAIVASFMHLPEPLRSKTLTLATQSLTDGGLIIMEFFSKNQMLGNFPSGGPKDLSLLYSVDELAPLFSDSALKVIQLEEVEDLLDEGRGHQGQASLIRLIVQKKA